MLIRTLAPRHVLSFGPEFSTVELKAINVLIGPNGSGKSNLLQVLRLLRGLATHSVDEMLRRDGGTMRDWIWRSREGVASGNALSLVVTTSRPEVQWSTTLEVSERGTRILEEGIERLPEPGARQFWLARSKDAVVIRLEGDDPIEIENLSPRESVLTQYRDSNRFPELVELVDQLRGMRIYAEWTLGRHSAVRRPQPADSPNDHLAEDCSNLGMILNRIDETPGTQRKLLDKLRLIYDGLSDVKVSIVGGTVQVYMHEGDRRISAARLSDGTLRWLCLLALVYQPDPPALVAIEEPELGLHPDLIPSLAELLIEASERMQLIVTTHSDSLVEALTGVPESIIVCEREDDSTVMRRLEPGKLKAWLEEYSLGELWRSGEIGGNRW